MKLRAATEQKIEVFGTQVAYIKTQLVPYIADGLLK
jgi:hypothetical protein